MFTLKCKLNNYNLFLLINLIINVYLINLINGFFFIPPKTFTQQQFNDTFNIFNYEHFYYQWGNEWPYNKKQINDFDYYDFIVIGAGSAGATIASRLSENPQWTVLLIEAGKPELSLFTDIPAICGFLSGTDFNWGYKMQRQTGACLAMENQECPWHRGKALGGTSVINYMIYTRGNKYDFKRWAGLGLPEWSWEEVLPYYLKSERAANLQYAKPQYHSTNGNLSVEEVSFKTPLVDAFLQSAIETNRKIVDYNSDDQFGFSPVQSTTRQGKRCSVAKAFLYNAGRRPNLTVLPLSRVTKILIHPERKQAYGVEYIRNRRTWTAYVKKEVVLSAGAFVSPQLLMLSGVGPKKHLEELDIEVIQDSPVGEYLDDHITFPGVIFLTNQSIGFDYKAMFQGETVLNYLYNQTGPLSSIGGVEAIGYIKTQVSNDGIPEYPDIELIQLAGAVNIDGGTVLRQAIGIRREWYDEAYKEINFKPSWSLFPMLLHPKSHGYLRLKSKNIFDFPILVGNYFTDPNNEDINTMIASVREIIKLSETSMFQRFGSKLYSKPVPGCRNFEFNSDDYWECTIRQLTLSLWHQVGTCRMGRKDDPMAVVNSQFKVIGIKNLRTADTSVIPFALSAHTNAPAIMLGERAADFLKKDWLNWEKKQMEKKFNTVKY